MKPHRLAELISHFPVNSIMAEVGCFRGDSTRQFLISGKVAKLFAIDPWKAGYDDTLELAHEDFAGVEAEFDRSTQGLNVVKLKMDFSHAAHVLPVLDIVYIDGDHRYDFVKQDILTANKVLRRGGILCGHDYSSQTPGVKQAVDELLNGRFIVVNNCNWINVRP